MDWERAIREERAALMRIATLLSALARLAELAAGRSAALRGFVIWLLGQAEAVAWDYVMDDPDAHFALMPAIPADNSPAEAMRLAVSFRALARELERQAALMLAMGGEGRCGTRQRSPGAIAALRALFEALSMAVAFGCLVLHPAPDTS